MFGAEEGMVVSAGIPKPTEMSWGTIGGSCVPIDVCWIIREQLGTINS